MSRYTKKQDSLEIAYGFDHATGYFFQVFDGEDEEGEDNLIIDECSLFTKLSNARMCELMEQYDIDREHITSVALDLPI